MKNTLLYKLLRTTQWHFFYYLTDIKFLFAEYFYDKKYNIQTSGYITSTRKEDANENKDETTCMPSSYSDLFLIMNQLALQTSDVFVDIGCGKARPVFLAATYPIKKSIGIELRKEAYDLAEENAAKLKHKKAELRLFHGDATKYDYSEGTVFFLFNPFGIKTFTLVLHKIHEGLLKNPRKISLVYDKGSQGTTECNDYLNQLDWLPNVKTLTNTTRPILIYSNKG